MKTVNIVSTAQKIRQYFPDDKTSGLQGILSADFSINPDLCQTALGLWLATHIATTRFDDDGAECRILYPATEAGIALADFAQSLSMSKEIRTKQDLEGIFCKMELFISRQRGLMDMYGESLLSYRITQYAWPVFGSAAAIEADTPEEFFDLCARQIRKSGGVILSAAFGAVLPEKILRTMAEKAGGGQALLDRHRRGLYG